MPEVGGQKPSVELAQAGGLQRARVAELANERFEALQRCGRDFDFDSPESGRRSPAVRADRGLVERDLPGRQALDVEEERASAGSHLEQRQQPLLPDDGTYARGHRPARAEKRLQVCRPEAFTQLAPAAQSRGVGGSRFEPFQHRHRVAAAAESTDPEGIAGPLEPPVVGLEVEIDLGHAVAACDDLDCGPVRLPLGHQPTQDRSQVECIELPLDLLNVVRDRRRRHGSGLS